MSETTGISREMQKRNHEKLRREILVLVYHHLMDEGLSETAKAMKEELRWNLDDFQPCDNVDLPLVFLEYLGYFHMRFHRRPKFCKKQSSDAILNRPLPIPQGPTLKSDEEEESVPSGGLVVPKSLTTTPESRELVAQILRHNLPPSKLFQNDWNTIIGHEEAKLALEELVILPFQHPELYSKCGLGHGTKSILLSGPPGTGKTSLVRCLASQAKFQFFNLSSSALVSKWRGDSEKLISIVFEVARHNSPSIVFLDEAESILGNRLINMEHEASKRSKSELLVQLDGLHEDQRPVLFVASTNMPWCLDPGFVRRFSRILKVGLPSQEERSQIIRNQFQSTQWNLDLAAIQNQTEGFSGAELVHACDQIKHKVFRQSLNPSRRKPTSSIDVSQILSQMKPSTGPEWTQRYSDWTQQHGTSQLS